MKKLLLVCAVMLVASPAMAIVDINNPFTTDANTMGLWHFDEVAGDNVAVDASANGNDATIDPNTSLYGSGPLDPNLMWAPAKFNNGTYTGNPSTNVGILVAPQDVPGTGGNSTLFIDGDFSVEFWMNATATSGGSWEHHILTKGTGSVFNIRFDQNVISVGWYGVGVAWTGIDDTTIIPLNEWHHVAMLVDNKLGVLEDQAYIEFYIDGVFSSSATVAAFQDDPSQGYDLSILGPMGGHPFNGFQGQLDELRISNIVRDYVIPEPSMMLLALGALAIFRRK